MNRPSAVLVASLALVAAQALAREPQPPPSPSANSSSPIGTIKEVPNESGYGSASFFVGRYGEAIEFPYDWAPKAELRGKTEVIYFHRKFKDDKSLHPFQPKPADYQLENFAPLELMELVVIPKDVPGGLSSLAEIRRAKEKELAQKGVDFKIVDEKNEYAWPQGTFHVRTMKPYRTVQTYGESPKEFFILTTGGYLAAGDYGLSGERASDYNYAAERALESLRQHLLAVRKKSASEYISVPSTNLFSPAPEMPEDFLSSFMAVRFVALYGTLGTGMMLLAFWPGATPGARRARLFGRSLFLFSHLAALIGFLFVYIPISFAGVMWRSSEDATLIPVLTIPWVSWLAARRLGSAHAKRVLISTAVIAALWTILWLLTRQPADTLPPAYDILGNTVILHLLGVIFGADFALACGPLPQKGVRR